MTGLIATLVASIIVLKIIDLRFAIADWFNEGDGCLWLVAVVICSIVAIPIVAIYYWGSAATRRSAGCLRSLSSRLTTSKSPQ